MAKYTLLFFTLATLCTPTFGQSKTTEGVDFWFGFMQNREKEIANVYATLEVFISSKNGAKGTLEMPKLSGFTPMDFDIPAGGSVTLTLRDGNPGAGNPDPMPKFSNTHNTGIHITSDDTISVFAINKAQFTADAAVILPTPSLGKEYYAITHWEDPEPPGDFVPNNLESGILVVAAEDDTRLKISRVVNTGDGGCHYESDIITLDRGEAHQLLARGGTSSFCGGPTSGDMSGTHVISLGDEDECKPFAVFAGSVSTQVTATDEVGCEDGAADHLFEQMLPVSTWGSEYVALPFATRSKGFFKVLASDDNTAVLVTASDGTLVLDETLQKGEVKTFTLTDSLPAKVSASQPISLLHLSRSSGCDSTESDPFSLVISPLEQRLRSVTFNVFEGAPSGGFQYYLNMVIPTSDRGEVRYDGTLLNSSIFKKVEADTSYSYGRLYGLDVGTHSMSAPHGFISSVYGYGDIESYGYATGASLIPIKLSLSLTNDLTGSEITLDDICLGATVTFSVSSDNPGISEFTWDFGDGSPTQTGSEVTHTYATAGHYTIRVLGQEPGAGLCTSQELLEAQIELLPVELMDGDTLIGPAAICPGATGVQYKMSGNAYEQYFWTVTGGTITSQSDSTITVDWGDVDTNASVIVFGQTPLGCYTDTLMLRIYISPDQKVRIPILGDTLICPAQWQDNLYTFDPLGTPTTTWDWVVFNGTVRSTLSDGQVTVDWDETASGHWLTVVQNEAGTIPCAFPAEDTLFVEVKPDALQGLNFDFASWPEAGLPDTEVILRFENSSVEIDPTFDIYRRQTEITQQDIFSSIGSSTTTSYTDDQVLPASRYTYQLEGIYTCSDSPFRSDTVQTIYLTALELNRSVSLTWTPHDSSPAMRYAIWESNNDQTYQLLTLTSGETSQLTSDYIRTAASDATHSCFKIEAIDPSGLRPSVWSNEACAQYGDTPILTPLITPNGDGQNDLLRIQNEFVMITYELVIFSRWGQEVFRGNQDTFDGWSGQNAAGEPLSAGTYFYVLKWIDHQGTSTHKNGAVTIIR